MAQAPELTRVRVRAGGPLPDPKGSAQALSRRSNRERSQSPHPSRGISCRGGVATPEVRPERRKLGGGRGGGGSIHASDPRPHPGA